jgi:hypothetical protein
MSPGSRTRFPRWLWSSRQPLEIVPAALLQRIQLGQRLIEVSPLRLQGVASLFDVADQILQLTAFTGLVVVEIEHVGDLGQGKSEPLAAQDQLQPYPIPIVEDPRRTGSFWSEQTAILVEPDGTQRGVELGR